MSMIESLLRLVFSRRARTDADMGMAETLPNISGKQAPPVRPVSRLHQEFRPFRTGKGQTVRHLLHSTAPHPGQETMEIGLKEQRDGPEQLGFWRLLIVPFR